MTAATDFLLDATGDLRFSDTGDFVVGESDAQHVQHLLLAYPGYYRLNPLVGVGLRSYEQASGVELELQRLVRIQMEADHYLINRVEVASSSPLKIVVDVDRIY